jgi:1-acyl-sn-glycerol-3-phosphate acyltransferase
MRLETLLRLGRLAARILYRYEAHGVENVPATGPCILGCNHPGKLLGDMFAMLAIMPRRMPVVVAPELMYRGPMASRRVQGKGELWGVRLLQTGVKLIPSVGVARSGDGIASQNLAMLKALDAGEAVFLAVEGEVAWDGRPNPARPGAPWMALRSGAPFVPIGITGSYDVWPRWEVNPHLTGKVIVRVGQPFRLTETTLDWIDDRMLEEAGQRIMTEISKLVG